MEIGMKAQGLIYALALGMTTPVFTESANGPGRGGTTPGATRSTGAINNTGVDMTNRGGVSQGTTGSSRGDPSGGMSGNSVGRGGPTQGSISDRGTNTARADCDPRKNPNARNEKNCIPGTGPASADSSTRSGSSTVDSSTGSGVRSGTETTGR